MKTVNKYADFLTSKEVYFENQACWKNKLAELSREQSEPWVITQFANGEDFLDGNPIASALYRHLGKAVRIIQTDLDSTIPQLRVWLEKAVFYSTPITELVVVVQPSEESFNAAIDIISFFTSETSRGKVHRYIRAMNDLYKQIGIIKKNVNTIYTMNPQQLVGLKDTIRNIYQNECKKKPISE